MFAQCEIGVIEDPVSWGWLITWRSNLAKGQIKRHNKMLSFTVWVSFMVQCGQGLLHLVRQYSSSWGINHFLSFFLSFLQIFHLLLTNNVSIPVILWQSGLRNLYLLSNKALHITPASSFKHAPALCFGYTRRCLQKALPRDLYMATAVSKPWRSSPP